MILIWLGSFVLLMYAVEKYQGVCSDFFSKFQSRFLDKSQSKLFLNLAPFSILSVLADASPMRSLYSGMALYNLRISNLRTSVLIMCAGTLGSVWVLLLASLFLNFSGYFFLGLAVLGLTAFSVTRQWKALWNLLLSIGLFLIAGESLLKNSSILQTLLGQGELAFFLADGRFGSVIVIALCGIILGLLLRVEFWSLILAMGLVVAGNLSLNGALGLILGERLAHLIWFFVRTRNLNQDCRRLGGQFVLASGLGAVLGFFVAGEFKTFVNFGFTLDVSATQEKSFLVIILYALILMVQFVAQMTWGHFAGNAKIDEIQDVKYLSNSWIEEQWISGGVRLWAKDKVHKRLSEIRYHLQGLGSMKEGQIPEFVQKRLKEEELQLGKIQL